MTISELITKLETLQAEHGDLPVEVRDDAYPDGSFPFTAEGVEVEASRFLEGVEMKCRIYAD